MKQIDVVTCVYNETAVIDVFLKTILAVFDNLPAYRFRLIITNDGSTDSTKAKLKAAWQGDDRIMIINLSRNFGHEAALAAGLKAADGDAVIVLDADLQDPPELIGKLLTEWEAGYDVVNACRVKRKEDSFLKRGFAKLFYRTINALSGPIKIPENVGNFRLISRRVLNILNSLPEQNRVFRVLVPFLGFPTSQIGYDRPARPAGFSHYNWSKMTRLAVDGITSATIIPLKITVNVGFFISSLGFAYMLYIIVLAIFTNQTIQGWPSIMSAILFLGGIQLVFLGVIGEYIGRIFLEVKARPGHIIQETWPNQNHTRQ